MDFKSALLSVFVEQLLPVLGTALASVIVAAFGFLTWWLRQKSQAEGASTLQAKGLAIIARATELMKNVVAHSEAELRPLIQRAAADGQLTPAEAAEIKAKTLEIFKRELGAEGLIALKDALGGSLEVFLSGLLERVVIGLKIDKSTATGGVDAIKELIGTINP